MNNNNYLNEIINCYNINFSILKNAYLEYKNSSQNIKDEYLIKRKNFVEKYTSSFFDDGTILFSSGSSTGFKKKYIWGPNWEKFYYFYEWLKFEHFEPYDLYFIQLNHPLSRNKEIKIREGKRNYKILEINSNFITKAAQDIIKKTKNDDKKKIILWFNPSCLRYLINQNFDFNLLNFNKFIIYSTGELLDENTKIYLKNKGFFVIDAMKCWDGGATFITCEHGNTHWIDFLSIIESDDQNNLISSDLYNLSQNFLNYKNGDKILTHRLHNCKCGLPIDYIKFIKTDSYCFEQLGISWDYQNLQLWIIASIKSVSKNIMLYPLFSMSFGYHKKTKNIVAFLGTKIPLNISNQELKKISISFKISLMIDMNDLIICNWPRFGKYKQERMFFISDEEYKEVTQKNNSFIKII